MITINETLDAIKQKGIYITIVPEDWARSIGPREITEKELRELYPEKYRNDIAGFDKGDWSYKPVFATMQEEWDKELNDFYYRKMAWCRKYGCD